MSESMRWKVGETKLERVANTPSSPFDDHSNERFWSETEKDMFEGSVGTLSS
jgi:hypothetical protein